MNRSELEYLYVILENTTFKNVSIATRRKIVFLSC